jgi:hypothetical protein
MNDLIEHLKASGGLGQRAVKLIEQLLADSNIQQTRIAELESFDLIATMELNRLLKLRIEELENEVQKAREEL